jgi:hypothetical protein
MDELADLCALVNLLETCFNTVERTRLSTEQEAALWPGESFADGSWVVCVDSRFTLPVDAYETCSVCAAPFGQEEDVYHCGVCLRNPDQQRRGAHYLCWKSIPGMVCPGCGGVMVE